ncbi:hypothetical protein SVAN01_06323 [Stagonosporopsis vannaccii]|nr:hypothetical protein SVAN01_06323 [Stagonosporopsis vannaccii]
MKSTMSIRPLPDEVVAQIKSSTAIVSLTEVVIELVKNSLDAKATRIEVTVDFARGACVVEDDGLGISPAEFSEDGGLGKRYCTSKFHSEELYLGQHGTFLASLSVISLLTITSHHHAYRSQNSISFHHAQPLERQIPTPAHNHVRGKHGTRVTVRNLFGNMPVRVKQRALVVDQKTEQHRLRNALKRETVGLLLSWQKPLSLKIRNGDGTTIVHVNTSHTTLGGNSRGAEDERPRSAYLSSLLQVMTQANYINVDQWSSWVPASASTPAISVKGAISLEPAPTKRTQFISLGSRPLSSESGANELYDQINRLFAMSSFGVIEDDDDVDEQETLRRLSDKRYKHDGYTKRQLKARKGVDRFPMFHFRVALADRAPSEMWENRFIEDESNLQAVVDVFSAMITQWLSVHHFCPRNPRQAADQTQTMTASRIHHDERNRKLSRKRQASLSSLTRFSTPEVRSPATRSTKKQRSARPSPERSLGRARSQAFADWSRIKSGKSSFFDTASNTQKPGTLNPCQEQPGRPVYEGSGHLSSNGGREQTATFGISPAPKGALGSVPMTTPLQCKQILSVPDKDDETIVWTDPSTKKTYRLHARTGCVIPHQIPQTDFAALSPYTTRLNTRKSVRLAPKSTVSAPVKTLWLDHLLQNWDNPVFKPTEQGFQQLSLQDGQSQGNTRPLQHSHTRCSHFDMEIAFSGAGSTSSKLSKEALRRADVISQVDKKFILVRMRGTSPEFEMESCADIMVLIDQHAADERVQVESLLHDLCAPMRNEEYSNSQSESMTRSSVAQVILEKPLHFAISSPEHSHFKTFKANFAAWSILYDTGSSASLGSRPGMSEKGIYKLSITALPPSIVERCKADPSLLISFLRSAVWKYADSPPLPPAASNDPHTSWVKKIATCPPGLVDMINSRACRSAIMFNDELSLEECRVLVKKLADCVFPFMCAHGRPSMVPIVDMGRVGGSAGTGEDSSKAFVEAWTTPPSFPSSQLTTPPAAPNRTNSPRHTRASPFTPKMPREHLIDVRTPQEFSTGYLTSDLAPTINIEYTSIASLADIYATHNILIEKTDHITLYCRSGRRSDIAKKVLEGMGYGNVRDIGGFEAARGVLDRETVGRQLEGLVGEGDKEEGGDKGGKVEGDGKEGMRRAGLSKLLKGLEECDE